jgi:quinoprotein glucose dehydrogenase
MSFPSRRWFAGFVLCCSTLALAAEPYSPTVAPASNEAERAIKNFKVPDGMSLTVVAAEPLLAQPVAFGFDEQGRVYVAETFRLNRGVEDNRGHMNWLTDDLAAQTVEDRRKYFQKFLGDKIENYTREHDRVRQLVDDNGDGVYDRSTVFADGFNDLVDGIGSGVLAVNGSVYYTCIPHLWLLKDRDGDGVAEIKQSLHSGYGVRTAFVGHDMHGLTLGPDGKLYYSIGDRGFHVETPTGVLHHPDQGAVFRCNLDGSELEIVNTGLRNPQELAFDEFGNLFTGDNNSDGGDRARWVYLIEGSDTGWRMYYQYLPDRGPWNREKLWHPQHAGQPAYLVPPIANFADGPSGLVHYPGVGLPERYRGHFFLADFRGSPVNSGIRSFGLAPKGASFEMTDTHEFVWSILATDVDFGYDGRMYLSDWVDGWGQNGKGRLYRLDTDGAKSDPQIARGQEAFRKGFDKLATPELMELLTHPDYRVRQRAQFQLADRNAAAELLTRAKSAGDVRHRLHGVWGLGQIGRRQPNALRDLWPLLSDNELEIRANTARVLGDLKFAPARESLVALLADQNARVRSLAAIAVGKLGVTAARPALEQLLTDAGDADPTLRHAAVMGLVGISTPEQLAEYQRHPQPAVRMGAVVALRRTQSPLVERFLSDAEPLIALEAARTIHDLPLTAAYPAVAALLSQMNLPDELLRRAVNAHFRLGEVANVQAVARFAANPKVNETLRLDAVGALHVWNDPPVLDRYLGDYRPLQRPPVTMPDRLLPALPNLFAGSPALREAAAKLAAKYEIGAAGEFLATMAVATDRAASERVAALNALSALKDDRLPKLIDAALSDQEPAVRSAAFTLLAKTNPDAVLARVPELRTKGTLIEQQAAVDVLARLSTPAAEAALTDWLAALNGDGVPKGLWLELLEAAESHKSDAHQAAIARFRTAIADSTPSAGYRECLEGGDADRGRELFFSRSDLSCRRCHKIQGDGGDVGPNLSALALQKPREYLLEAVVDPNRAIAKGFETAVLQTEDGKVHVGIIKQETADRITLQAPDGAVVNVDPKTVEERAVGKSGMPEDLVKKLTRRELRDLVEFLASCRREDESVNHGTTKSGR